MYSSASTRPTVSSSDSKLRKEVHKELKKLDSTREYFEMDWSMLFPNIYVKQISGLWEDYNLTKSIDDPKRKKAMLKKLLSAAKLLYKTLRLRGVYTVAVKKLKRYERDNKKRYKGKISFDENGETIEREFTFDALNGHKMNGTVRDMEVFLARFDLSTGPNKPTMFAK